VLIPIPKSKKEIFFGGKMHSRKVEYLYGFLLLTDGIHQNSRGGEIIANKIEIFF
jgi:hypothetical protein